MTQDQIEAETFEDLAHLRANGHSLCTIAIDDMRVHEDICDFIESAPNGDHKLFDKPIPHVDVKSRRQYIEFILDPANQIDTTSAKVVY